MSAPDLDALERAAFDDLDRTDWRKPLSDDGVDFVRRRVEAFWREPITPRLELERVPMTFVSALLARVDDRDARLREAERQRDEARADAARYRYLRDHHGSHYPMTWEQPAEWSIQWESQQRTPSERFGTFDSLIDQDIAYQATLDAEDDAALPPPAGSETGEG